MGISAFILAACETPYELTLQRQAATAGEVDVPLDPVAPSPGDNDDDDVTPAPSPTSMPSSAPSPVASPVPSPMPTSTSENLSPGIWIKLSEIHIDAEGKVSDRVIARPDEMVNVLALKDDVLGVLRISLPVGAKVQSIRLITRETGHRVISPAGEDLCPAGAKVPAGTSSGFKMHLGGLEVAAGVSYKLTLRTDSRLVVFHSKGTCNIHSNYQ